FARCGLADGTAAMPPGPRPAAAAGPPAQIAAEVAPPIAAEVAPRGGPGVAIRAPDATARITTVGTVGIASACGGERNGQQSQLGEVSPQAAGWLSAEGGDHGASA